MILALREITQISEMGDIEFVTNPNNRLAKRSMKTFPWERKKLFESLGNKLCIFGKLETALKIAIRVAKKYLVPSTSISGHLTLFRD